MGYLPTLRIHSPPIDPIPLMQLFDKHTKILVECAIAERLRRLPEVELHPTLFNTPLIYTPGPALEAMSTIYREYIAIAEGAGLPLLLTAPTWRLDAHRVREAEVPLTINSDAVHFLKTLVTNATPSVPVKVGALIGPQNDCYRPDLAPALTVAKEHHRDQIAELAKTEADFLLAQTLPALPEATAIAQLIVETGKPSLISFCTGPDGHVLDGTPLPEAMATIDEATSSPPLGYFVNCTHPQFLLDHYQPGELRRLIGIQANGSAKDVRRLDGSSQTEADPLAHWTHAMLSLHNQHKVTALGGCCGTTSEHLSALAKG